MYFQEKGFDICLIVWVHTVCNHKLEDKKYLNEQKNYTKSVESIFLVIHSKTEIRPLSIDVL